MPVKNLLYVCTANVLRSPFVEKMTKQFIEESDTKMNVESVGMLSYIGRPNRKEILDMAKRYGVDLSAHVPRQVNSSLINWSDLNLVFENWQVIGLTEKFPDSRGKTRTISEYSGLNDDYGKEDLYCQPVEKFEEFFIDTRVHVKRCLDRMKVQE